MKVLGMSVITDECFPDSLKPVNISEIIQHAKNAEPNLMTLMKRFIVLNHAQAESKNLQTVFIT